MAQSQYEKSYFYSRVTTLHSADMSLLEKGLSMQSKLSKVHGAAARQ